jgi:tetratricopeptide (TPR) repeat protein
MRLRKQRVVACALSCLVGTCWVPGLALAADPAPGAAAPKAASPAAAAPSSAPSTPEAAGPAAAAPAGPSPEVMAEAKQRFDRGFELYEEGEYPLALIEFNRAYELVPNYRVLYNIGQVCIQLGQYANARRALTEYVKHGGDSLAPDRRASVNKDLEMIARRTAFLTVNGNVEFSEVLVDDVLVGKTPLDAPLLVDAGVHRVTLRRSGYLPRTTNVTLAGGDEQTLNVTLEVQPDEKQTIVVREREIVEDSAQTWMIAGWATTGALIAGAVVTGIMGSNEADELEQLRGANSEDYENPSLADRMSDTKDNAKTLLLASDIMTGAALIVGGLSLWITLDPPEPERAVVPETPAPKPEGVQVGYADGQLLLRGKF